MAAIHVARPWQPLLPVVVPRSSQGSYSASSSFVDASSCMLSRSRILNVVMMSESGRRSCGSATVGLGIGVCSRDGLGYGTRCCGWSPWWWMSRRMRRRRASCTEHGRDRDAERRRFFERESGSQSQPSSPRRLDPSVCAGCQDDTWPHERFLPPRGRFATLSSSRSRGGGGGFPAGSDGARRREGGRICLVLQKADVELVGVGSTGDGRRNEGALRVVGVSQWGGGYQGRGMGGKRRSGLRVRCAAVGTAGKRTGGVWDRDPDPDSSILINMESLRLSRLAPTTLPPLPSPPANSTIFSVMPYLWELAASDANFYWRISVALGLLFLGKAAGLMSPVLFKNAVDALTSTRVTSAAAAAAAANSPPPLMFAISCLVMACLVKAVSALFNELRYIIFAPLGHAAGGRVALHFFHHILDMDMAFHLERKTGSLSRILDRGMRSVSQIFRAVVFTFVPTAVELVLVCALLAQHVSPLLAGIVFTTFITYVAWTISLTKAAAVSRKEVNVLDNLTTGKAVDALLNYETVLQFNNQSLEATQYDGLLQAFCKASIRAEYIMSVMNAGQAIILAVGTAFVMGLAGNNVLRGTMTVGDLVLANGLVLQLSAPLQFLGFLYRDMRQSLVDMENMFTLLGTKSELKDGTVVLPYKESGVEVSAKHLKFGYSPTRQVLRGVSLNVNRGQSIAIVGSSGSGKSTIVKLLLRFFDPDEGSVMVDGCDVKSLTQESLRRAVAVVPQDTVLFNDTIFHNISYGRPGASEGEVIHASKQAHLHEAIMRMPGQYNTVVGERGLKLSGGEKQRVAIARAFLKAPRLLICDEATSALDSATEGAILASLKELAAGRTCIFVAHRLSTIKHCDHILVMEMGRVVEEGSHDELIARDGKYARMWNMQKMERPLQTLVDSEEGGEEEMRKGAVSSAEDSKSNGDGLTPEMMPHEEGAMAAMVAMDMEIGENALIVNDLISRDDTIEDLEKYHHHHHHHPADGDRAVHRLDDIWNSK